MLLARTWNGTQDVAGWHVSEKLDGVRALWDGRRLLTRSGAALSPPTFWTRGLPSGMPLDGEVWAGRGRFEHVQSVVQSSSAPERWRGLRFCVFDAPRDDATPWERRMAAATEAIGKSTFALAVPTVRAPSDGERIHDLLESVVEDHGAEGLMLRRPGSRHEVGRSGSLLKAKRTLTGHGTVLEIAGGKGRLAGVMGSVLLRTAGGRRVRVGAGFTDEERRHPPRVGSRVAFTYRETTAKGVPRFAAYDRGVSSRRTRRRRKVPVSQDFPGLMLPEAFPSTTRC